MIHWRAVLFVGLGGFLGSSLRFVVSTLAQRLVAGSFPLGTLAVNVLGCLAIGWFAGLSEAREVLGASQRLFVLIGFLGGFTTFSTFGYETLALAQGGEGTRAVLNVAAQLTLGLGAAWTGFLLGSGRLGG